MKACFIKYFRADLVLLISIYSLSTPLLANSKIELIENDQGVAEHQYNNEFSNNMLADSVMSCDASATLEVDEKYGDKKHTVEKLEKEKQKIFFKCLEKEAKTLGLYNEFLNEMLADSVVSCDTSATLEVDEKYGDKKHTVEKLEKEKKKSFFKCLEKEVKALKKADVISKDEEKFLKKIIKEASKDDTFVINIEPPNTAPLASAGADIAVYEQQEVALDGTLSFDPDGEIQQFSWLQTDLTGVTVTLSGADTVTPTFTAPEISTEQQLTFRLSVTDNENATADDEVNIVIKPNSAPQADHLTISTFIDTPVIPGQLSAIDPDDHSFTYHIESKPTLGSITEFDKSTGEFSYSPSGNTGTDQFTFTVSDYLDTSSLTTVTINIAGVDLQENQANDDSAAAITVFQNSSITAALDDATDHDWFVYNAFTDGSVAFSLDFPTSSADAFFFITITDENGQIISEQMSGKDIVVYESTVAGQKYFIQITSTGNLSTDNYVLSLENFESAKATLSWERPLFNVDGSPLEDLDGYNIYYGVESENLDQIMALEDESLTTFVIKHLRQDELYFFTMTSINSSFIESDYSNVVSKQF